MPESRSEPANRRAYQTRAELTAAVTNLPTIDGAQLRADLDAEVDSDAIVEA